MASIADILDRADELADQLKALTDRTNAAALASVRADLVTARQSIVADWVLRFGGVDAKPAELRAVQEFTTAAEARLERVFAKAGPVASRALSATLPAAYNLGVEQGLQSAPVAPEGKVAVHVIVPTLVVLASIAAVRLATSAALNPMQLLLTGFPAVARTLKTADRVVTRIEAVNAFEVTRASSDGTTAVAKATGSARMWVSERDACVNCAAYAGVTTQVDVFPVGLSFGDKPIVPPGPLTGPALHSHCRCALELIDPADVATPAALKREAKRSVLRGFSLPTESEPARLRAADRLLAQYPGLPKTVERYAERAVRRGKFPSRDVPTGA